MDTSKRFQPRAHLTTYALLSFIVSFIIARVFTTFLPSTVIFTGGLHIHHFWFGLALLAAGGWLGINFNEKDLDRLAAILYGIGGGLIVDEIGLLLTFEDYWSGLTFSFLVIMLAVVSVFIFLYIYRESILRELGEFGRSKASFYIGVFLFVISIAFIAETSNRVVEAISAGLATVATVIIAGFLILKIRERKRKG